MRAPSRSVEALRVRPGTATAAGRREAPEEAPVAIVHDGSTYAVMMATPADLEDLAVGLSLTEGAIADVGDIREIEVVEREAGIEARMWLAPERSAALAARRRTMAGPTGCGLCGLESLQQVRATPRARLHEIAPLTLSQVQAVMEALAPAQVLGRATRAAHAAGLWTADEGLAALREDVGRHNALDKLIGALARQGAAAAGVLAMTSRISVELVQKAVAVGAPVIAAVSAPTALAIDTAQEAGVTLIGVARSDGFEVFTHPWRVIV